jgi:vacuolar protein sorting-associated protein IST1
MYLSFSFSDREIDEGLLEPIASIIWATPRLIAEVQELKVVRDQLTAKYGKEFVQACTTNQDGNVNEKLMHKLSVQAIPRQLTDKYLEEIARCYKVPFSSGSDSIEVDESFTSDHSVGGDGSSGGGGGGGKRASISSPRGNVPFTYPQPHTQV